MIQIRDNYRTQKLQKNSVKGTAEPGLAEEPVEQIQLNEENAGGEIDAVHLLMCHPQNIHVSMNH